MILHWLVNLGMFGGATPPPPIALTFRETLVAKLGSIPALTAIVGNAIYPGAIPEPHDFGVDGPALTYVVMSYVRNHVLSGSDGTATARVRLVAWSYSESVSDAIALAIRNAIDGPPVNPWAVGGVTILSSNHADEDDYPEPPRAGTDKWVYQIPSQYTIRHRVPIPTLS